MDSVGLFWASQQTTAEFYYLHTSSAYNGLSTVPVTLKCIIFPNLQANSPFGQYCESLQVAHKRMYKCDERGKVGESLPFLPHSPLFLHLLFLFFNTAFLVCSLFLHPSRLHHSLVHSHMFHLVCHSKWRLRL